ncbi:uncharacterized protein LOC134231805 [Saccostrea cucullata]|uniref:uncharacterized protein LOC134231805 n=1 Tax=Saccostrea cuccullata TaxID=36930 RepID=UPI002ED07B99
MCTKFHRKHLLSRDHSICPLNELKSQHIQSAFGKNGICKKHPDHELSLYCYKHEQPCCIICGGIEHRQCDSVEPVEKVAQSFKESGKINNMLEDVRSFKQKLVDGKHEQEKSITQLEITLDKVTEETEKVINDIVCLIERLKNEHLDEFSAAVKKGKEMLNKNVATFSDGTQSKQTFEQLQTIRFRTRDTQIMAKREPILEEIAKMKKIACVDVIESAHDIPVNFDVSNVQLYAITEFSIAEGKIRSGTWLSNKIFIFSNGEKGKVCYGEIKEKKWKVIGNINFLKNPFDILQKGNEFFVTCIDSNSIGVFSVSDFKKLRTIRINYEHLGITSWMEEFYLACGFGVAKVDDVGNFIQESDTQCNCASHITTTKFGNIVYTDWKENQVTAITEKMEKLWDYISPELKCQYGIDSDSKGNVYVAGMKSHNIHVISNTGEFIRLFQNMRSPVFMKIDEKRKLCCVCSNYKTITFYEMK